MELYEMDPSRGSLPTWSRRDRIPDEKTPEHEVKIFANGASASRAFLVPRSYAGRGARALPDGEKTRRLSVSYTSPSTKRPTGPLHRYNNSLVSSRVFLGRRVGVASERSPSAVDVRMPWIV
ncbi:hypothetical protein EVAR_8946_1 [Eumeta japonica]|uniref:Uncharacterized protein n=1 Tax=Eumeta variegata TaxID=151549 RepID=A0A4C1U0D0_EUMVA|nr:hypothetical protein EVAR_8946_1 [Eumeta japonica]